MLNMTRRAGGGPRAMSGTAAPVALAAAVALAVVTRLPVKAAGAREAPASAQVSGLAGAGTGDSANGLASSATAAIEEPLATDRPGNGNAASSVPLGALQLEASAAFLHQGGEESTFQSLSFPTLLRFGLLSALELRLGSNLAGVDLSEEAVELTDTFVGAKWQLLHGSGLVPDLAVMADVFLPTGGGAFTSDQAVPEARVATAWSLAHGFGLLLNVGADLPQDDDGRYAQALYVVNLSYVPPFARGRASVFVESFGRVVGGSRSGLAQLDAGAAYLLNKTLQLDLFTQHGLTDTSPDFQLSLGLSKRW